MPTKLSQKQIVMLGTGVFLAVVLAVLFFFGLRPKQNSAEQTKLSVWGTEDKNALGAVLANYPYAAVSYTQIDPSQYETELLAALAAGTGPDVFEIGNRALPRWKQVLAPVPAAYAQTFGTLQLSENFPDVVSEDFVSNGGAIYGLPLSIDTLALVYNKDIFNSAGIAFPPKTWDDFDADVAKLRVLNSQGQITRSGAALGGSGASIANAPDILSLFMLQNGAQMTNEAKTNATFASANSAGVTALDFYLQFSNAASPYYTWNDGMGNALDNFVNGKTAMVLLYESDLAALKQKAPFLNVGVAAMPQPSNATVTVNYPKYQAFVVAKAGQQTAAAWSFIIYLTTGAAPAAGGQLGPTFEKAYVVATGKPPATRAEIQARTNDAALSVFAAQALTARSWYEVDDVKIASILNGAIQNVLIGAADSARALKQAETAVNQIIAGH